MFGEEISLDIRDMGITVAANYEGNSERAEALNRRTGIRNYKWDVGDVYACEDFYAKIAEDMGPVDIVVNNEGIPRDGTALNMTLDHLNTQTCVICECCVKSVQSSLSSMPARGGRLTHTSATNIGTRAEEKNE